MTHPLHRRSLIAGAAAFAGTAALAQEGVVRVTLNTAKGAITLELNAAKAPITTKNFLRYVDAKRFDHATFYRVTHAPNDASYGLIQGGVHGDRAKLFKPIAHESTLVTGLAHKDGTISMARGKPGSAGGEFFICMGDHVAFDAQTSGEGDIGGFAAFGQVVQGMEVCRAIYASPTGNGGPAAMRGQMLSPPVTIVSARRA
jgi:peptidyl-prolyl cis-trans isomerase A (cyclophilin A)